MKNKYKIAFFLLYYIFSLSFGEGQGEVSAQQLSSRYIKFIARPNLSKDTTFSFSEVTPTNKRGEMVGIGSGVNDHGGAPYILDPTKDPNYMTYIYRLDSTGKCLFLKNIKFPATGISQQSTFQNIIPANDSLYILGTVPDNDPPPPGFAMYSSNKFIIKTDVTGKVAWKTKFGYYAGVEYDLKSLSCTDGGLLVSGIADLGYNYRGSKSSARTTVYVTKYNADGSIRFNKAFRQPVGNDIMDSATGTRAFEVMVETPDKGYLMAGTNAYHPEGFKAGTTPSTLQLIKLDANGNKLWEKRPLYDSAIYRAKWINIEKGDIIKHPAGGYVLVGTIQINQWDSTEKIYNCEIINGKKQCYNVNIGGVMIKISELGNIEWTKVFRTEYKGVPEPMLAIQAIPLTSIALSNTNNIPTGFVLRGFVNANNGYLNTMILKTDFNGNLLWNKAFYHAGSSAASTSDVGYGYGSKLKIYEEPGGSLLVNTLADPELINADGNTTHFGVLRLNSEGDLGDGSCSVSPKIEIRDETPPVAYDTIPFIFETTPPLTGTLPPDSTYNHTTFTTFTANCVNPILAKFLSPLMACSDPGTVVGFTDASVGASWFNFNFGDTASGVNNISDAAYSQHLYRNSGTYTVTLTIWDGDSTNVDSISQTVEIKPRRNITILPGNTTMCQGTAFNISAKINTGSLIGCYLYNKEGIDISNFATSYTDSTFNSNPFPFGIKLSYYMSTGTTCTISDTAVITVLPKVNMSVRGENTTFCVGDSALLIASGSNSYLWNPGGTTNDSLKVYPSLSSTYTVSSGKTKVCGTDSALIKVTVNLKPIIDAGADQTIFPGKQAPLLATGGSTYLWSPALGLSATNIANPLAEPEKATTYIVKGTDANSCVSSDSVTVNLKFCGVDLFVPNAFSPNGDNQNDVFYVKTLNNNCIQTFELKIFDRWGNKVFVSEDINTGWNGAYKEKIMDSGVFVYFLNALLEAGEIVTRKGNISLLR